MNHANSMSSPSVLPDQIWTETEMARVAVVLGDVTLRESILARFRGSSRVKHRRAVEADENLSALRENCILVYGPDVLPFAHATPDSEQARRFLNTLADRHIQKLILLSNAAVYSPNAHNPGLLSESNAGLRTHHNTIADRWLEIEAAARKCFDSRLIILRLASVLSTTSKDYVPQLLRAKIAVTLPGHDPSIQLLSPDDVVEAVCCAVASSAAGVYNVAPDGVIPLRVAFRRAGVRRLPLSRKLLQLAASTVRWTGKSYHAEQLEYLRYSWTISNRKIKKELGFSPSHSTVEVLQKFLEARSGKSKPVAGNEKEFDDFGMDTNYIKRYQRTLFAFLAEKYWRIEVQGTNHIPREGGAVLVGVHRGFMPWDGVMALHVIAQRTGRYPRFLTHPALFKFPFLFNFMTKLGGVVACQRNAEHILKSNELLGVFPEGINGTFTLYRDAYKLKEFGHNAFVKLALRHRVPIIPFVTLGSAEIFPILAKIRSRFWTRYTEWPCFPITASLPFLPLPSKWHTQFLAPLHVEEDYPPEAAHDAALVRRISQDVRNRMQLALEQMLQKRQSIFFGSIFHSEVEG
jgi:1-acyl-sn-glycerol-3-phosphate acyltransferase/nucleoside-diphosphate-sugar epimerase